MNRRLRKLQLVLLVLLQIIIPAQIVVADTGPKPTMEFSFTGQDVTIVSGILFECNQPDCSDAEPLQELGPQRLYCESTSCRAIGYGFAPYHILEIEFSDGITRESNIFETGGFDSRYKVTVQPEDLLVEAQFNLEPVTGWLLWVVLCGCLLTAGLLGGAGTLLFLRRRRIT